MGGGKDNNHHADKGYYPPASCGSPHFASPYTSPPLMAHPYPYAQHGSIYPPPSSVSYPYPPPMYSPQSGYTPSGYGQIVYPPMSGHPGANPYAPQHHGHGSGNHMGAMLAGGAAAAAAVYGAQHLSNGHHQHGHHLGHFGKFKRHHHGYYGKFKHGKFRKHMRLGGKHGFFGGKHGILGWKHHGHGFFGGKYKRWK